MRVLVRKRRRIKWKNVFTFLFMLICFSGLIFSIIQIIKWKMYVDKTDEQIEQIQIITPVLEVEDTENTEIVPPLEEETPESTSSYWDYIQMNLINADFSKLKQINSSTVGWIKVNGTNINYPFVQYSDNEFYLEHSFDMGYNTSGWVYLDYRNNDVGIDRNSIIYAHGGNDRTLFGPLKNILNSDWINNTENYVLKISTEKENSLWQIFSIYRIPTTSDYLQIVFANDEEFLEFGNMLLNRSDYNFNTSVSGSDKILTLSTCYNDVSKVVVHAKLLKYESNQ